MPVHIERLVLGQRVAMICLPETRTEAGVRKQ